MEAVQRIRLIRIKEKMEKNPEFCNKFGIKNTSEYIAEKEPKKKQCVTILEVSSNSPCRDTWSVG